MNEIDQTHLREWAYRYATDILGDSATFKEIAKVMTAKARTVQGYEAISLSRLQAWVWFRDNGGKEKSAYLEKPYLTEEKKQERVTLYRKFPRGSEIETDVSCDSAFMLDTMPDIGAAIREKMPWVPREQPIYLQMDNAGGHGTKAAVDEYTQLLRDRHNVHVIHQSPRSPEVNALDLGLWRSLQMIEYQLN